MNKKIRRIIVSSILCVGLFSAVAHAANKSTGDFTYGGFTARGSLNVTWAPIGNDTGSSRTDRVSEGENSRYVVTSYIEAQDSSSAVVDESNFDSGYTWAQADIIRSGVWRFNSTHGIAFSANKYANKTYRTLTDW